MALPSPPLGVQLGAQREAPPSPLAPTDGALSPHARARGGGGTALSAGGAAAGGGGGGGGAGAAAGGAADGDDPLATFLEGRRASAAARLFDAQHGAPPGGAAASPPERGGWGDGWGDGALAQHGASHSVHGGAATAEASAPPRPARRSHSFRGHRRTRSDGAALLGAAAGALGSERPFDPAEEASRAEAGSAGARPAARLGSGLGLSGSGEAAAFAGPLLDVLERINLGLPPELRDVYEPLKARGAPPSPTPRPRLARASPTPRPRLARASPAPRPRLARAGLPAPDCLVSCLVSCPDPPSRCAYAQARFATLVNSDALVPSMRRLLALLGSSLSHLATAVLLQPLGRSQLRRGTLLIASDCFRLLLIAAVLLQPLGRSQLREV